MPVSFGGQSMVAPLKRALLCQPAAAGWNSPAALSLWRNLGFLHEPDADAAAREHDQLRTLLDRAGTEVLQPVWPAGLTLDAVYVHDASLITDAGAICLKMGKASRGAEPLAHRAFYEAAGIPVLGQIEPPGKVESGDIVWLDERTLLVGRGYRTNREGIEQLRALVSPQGIEVIPAPLPHGAGPDTCLHLMSIMSVLDEHSALVDLPLLAVETVDLLRERALRLVEIEAEERSTLACNVLSIGNGTLVALEQNIRTNRRLQHLKYDVRTFSGVEIGINGGGGPTCLTRPILRDIP